MKKICFCIGCVLLSSTLQAEQFQQNLPLGGGIKFLEIDENNKYHHLSSAADIYRVDVNSTLFIKLDPVQIAESLPKSNSSEAVPAISPKTAQQRETLLDSLKALNNYLAIMKDIAALFEKYPSDSDIPGLPELMAQHADSRLKIEGAIKTYLNSDPSTNVNTVEAKLDELFDGPVKVWSERVAGFLRTEIRELDQESSMRVEVIKSNSNPFSLSLNAYLVREGSRVKSIHMPGYDSFDEGEYKPIEKISFSMSDADRKRLQTEMDFNKELSAKLNETKENRKRISILISTVLGEHIAKLKSFRIELDKTIQDIRLIIDKHLSQTEQNLQALIASQNKKTLEELNLAQDVLRGNLKAMQSFDDRLLAQFPAGEKLDALRNAKDPVEALAQLLKLTSEVPAVLRVASQQIESQSNMTVSSITFYTSSLKEKLEALPSDAQGIVKSETGRQEKAAQEIKSRLDSFKAEQVVPLIAHFAAFQKTAASLGSNVLPAMAMSEGLDPQIIEEKTIVRNYESIVDTKIIIPRTGRLVGDQIEIQINARDSGSEGEKTPIIAERTAVFNLQKYGAYSDFSTGAAGFFNTGVSDDAEFGAVASWLLHNRTRNNNTWNFLNPSIGVHTAGISTGLGMGICLNFLPENLIQIGAGSTLRSTGDNHWYWYVGMRLANFKMPGAAY